MSEKVYTCEGCGTHVMGDENVVMETHPDLFNHPLREVCLKIEADRGDKVPEAKAYHTKWVWSRRAPGGCACCGGNMKVICGPLHEETQEEYYVRQAGG